MAGSAEAGSRGDRTTTDQRVTDVALGYLPLRELLDELLERIAEILHSDTAAFLLLETRSLVTFSLLFGTTWFVNAAVFAGVLLSVLAAIELARRVRLPRLGWC